MEKKRRKTAKGDEGRRARARARVQRRQRVTKKGAGASCVSGGKYCGAINVTDKRVETTNKFFDG